MEVISSEDMLHSTKMSNEMVREKRLEEKRCLIRKWKCTHHHGDLGRVGPLKGEVPGPVGLSLGPHLPGAQGPEVYEKEKDKKKRMADEIMDEVIEKVLRENNQKQKLEIKPSSADWSPQFPPPITLPPQ